MPLRYAPAYQRRLSIRSRKKARESIRQVRRRLWSVTYNTKEAGRVLPVAWTLTTPTLDPSIVPGVCETREGERMLLAEVHIRVDRRRNDHAGLRGV